MFLSKPGKAVFIGALSLAAAPVLAMEPAPLDSAALSAVTALGADDPALRAWLPDPGGRTGLLPGPAIGGAGPADRDPGDAGRGMVRIVLQSGQTTQSFERQDSRGTSRIVQTGTIDLPRAVGPQATIGVVMHWGSYDAVGGGQSATNLAVAATFNDAGGFASIRP
jgi:hypothetical protein